jgi:hypothetical protein
VPGVWAQGREDGSLPLMWAKVFLFGSVYNGSGVRPATYPGDTGLQSVGACR